MDGPWTWDKSHKCGMDDGALSGEYGAVSSSSVSSRTSCTDREAAVVLTTPPLPLTLAVIQLWEREMLAVEQRWPRGRFLGWKTSWTPARASIGSGESDRHAAGERRRRTQRELVLESLLRRPADDRRGIVHRR
jgi:hypothetical protein